MGDRLFVFEKPVGHPAGNAFVSRERTGRREEGIARAINDSSLIDQTMFGDWLVGGDGQRRQQAGQRQRQRGQTDKRWVCSGWRTNERTDEREEQQRGRGSVFCVAVSSSGSSVDGSSHRKVVVCTDSREIGRKKQKTKKKNGMSQHDLVKLPLAKRALIPLL